MIDFTLHLKWKAATACFIFILCFNLNSYAQSTTITGKVIDAKTNETLIGATVQIKGTTNGTATDINGNFKLNATTNAVLEIQSIGYATVTLPADFSGPIQHRERPILPVRYRVSKATI